jgi:hypothetical protein
MDRKQINLEHRERIVHACSLAINHAALLCESMREFVEEVTTEDALSRAEISLVKIKNAKRELENAGRRVELNLLLAVEKLYRLHGKQISVSGRDFQDLLLLCWNAVAEVLDRQNEAKYHTIWDGYSGPLTVGEQKYHEEVVMPLIQQSFERLRIEEKEMKNELKKEKAVAQ